MLNLQHLLLFKYSTVVFYSVVERTLDGFIIWQKLYYGQYIVISGKPGAGLHTCQTSLGDFTNYWLSALCYMK